MCTGRVGWAMRPGRQAGVNENERDHLYECDDCRTEVEYHLLRLLFQVALYVLSWNQALELVQGGVSY